MSVLEVQQHGAALIGADSTRESMPLIGVATRPSARIAARSQTAIFTKLVGDFMRPTPVVVDGSTPCGAVVDRLTATGATAAVVVDAKGRPEGLLTEQDVTRRVTFSVSVETPVREVMTAPVQSIVASDYLYRAIATMRRLDIRHMPVTDTDTGRLVGMLDVHDAMAHAADRQMRQIDRLTHEGTRDGLKEIKAAQIELAEQMFADHLPAHEIQALLTHINNDLYRRVIRAVEAEMNDDGWGAPPVRYTVIVMGSGGRGENFLFPDQDNGLILEDYPDERHCEVDAWFREFAARLNRDLNDVGFPLCKGYCMASNPLWRKTLSQWAAQIDLWGRKKNFVAIRLADLFFDFLPVFGPLEPAYHLRALVLDHMRRNKFFLSAMWEEIKDHNVGIGLLGRFAKEKEDKDHRGAFDLKHWGTLPLVEAVRLLSLREGISETSTLKRIEALHAAEVLDAEEKELLSNSFASLTHLLLRQQLADYRAGRRVSNFVQPKSLTPREKQALLGALRTIDALRKRVRSEFTGDIF